jgi:hypothetical protein
MVVKNGNARDWFIRWISFVRRILGIRMGFGF